jgi:hypothetical protein
MILRVNVKEPPGQYGLSPVSEPMFDDAGFADSAEPVPENAHDEMFSV